MGRYLELLRSASAEEEPDYRECERNVSASLHRKYGSSETLLLLDAGAKKLDAAGWKHKRRGGLTIWGRPDTGFWVSQEMALRLLNKRNIKNKSGANARR